MGIYKIKTPDGQVMQVEGPDNATDDQIIAFAQQQLTEKRPKEKFATPVVDKTPVVAADTAPDAPAKARAAELDRLNGKAGIQDLLTHGALFGLTDEISGVGGAVKNALEAPFLSGVDFDPVGAYRTERDAERIRLGEARDRMPLLGGLSEIAGGFLTGRPGAGLAEVPNALAAIGSGAKLGAVGGALGGFGSGNDLETSLVGAGLGGTFGATLGAAVPAVAVRASNALEGLSRFLGRDQPGLARRVVGNALAADMNEPAAVGAQMDAARDLGVPRMLMDSGENARSLGASISRQPGPSRTIIRDAVIERQSQQGDRIRGAVERDLGPINNNFDVSDSLMRSAREAAAPLYDEAYAAPVISTPELESLLSTPAGRSALGRARTIAANERRDPTAMGFVEDEAGNVLLQPRNFAGNRNAVEQPGFTTQTLDYVKRGIDDVIEGLPKAPNGRPIMDENYRAIDGVRRQLLAEVDRLNPAYARARAAYAGPASARTALQNGEKAINMSDQELEQAVSRLTDADRQHFASGYRSALANQLDRRVDDADKARALLGSPRKRAALAQVFGGEEGFDRFLATMDLEREANDTFRAVATGSQTAGRLADDAQNTDAGLIDTAMDAAIRGGQSGGIGGAVLTLLARAKDTSRFGAGEAGNRVRQSVAALLTETDPAVLRQIVEEANAAVLRAADREARVTGGSTAVTRGLGQGISVAAGTMTGQ